MDIAKLGGDNLPVCFRYKPYIPKKRNSVTRTANAVVTQYPATTQIVHGDGVLAWSMEGAYPTEFQDLWDKYDTPSPVLYTFEGYWGEKLSVFFTTFDEPSVQGRLFNCSGQFQVIDMIESYDAEC